MINCNVVASCGVRTLESEVTLLQAVFYLLRCNVCGIVRANTARESGVCILMTAYRCLFSRGKSDYKLVI